MSEEQYWDKDCSLTEFFRKAEKIRIERLNEEMWLQGMYIYDAMARVSPLFRMSLGGKGAKPQPYAEKPYPIGDNEEENKIEEKKNYEKGKKYMEAYMIEFNKKLKERESNGNN